MNPVTTTAQRPAAIRALLAPDNHTALEATMTDQPTTWPTFTLQRWDWSSEQWETHGTYQDERGEGNAYFAMSVQRASQTGPIRLLKDGAVVTSDDPETYYDE